MPPPVSGIRVGKSGDAVVYLRKTEVAEKRFVIPKHYVILLTIPLISDKRASSSTPSKDTDRFDITMCYAKYLLVNFMNS